MACYYEHCIMCGRCGKPILLKGEKAASGGGESGAKDGSDAPGTAGTGMPPDVAALFRKAKGFLKSLLEKRHDG